jgi:hypothetical protein
MTTKDKIKYGVLAAAVIIILILIFSLFRVWQKMEGSHLNEIKALDKVIETEQRHRSTLEKIASDHDRTDSLLVLAIESNKPKYVANEKKYQNTAVIVRDLSKDDLRRAAIAY